MVPLTHAAAIPLCPISGELASQMVKFVLGEGGAGLAVKPCTSSFICTTAVWAGPEAGEEDPV